MASQYTSLTYPVFEPGQALKSKDLNALVDYLETHDRLTRAYLIGSGIFYGLKWTYLETVNGFNLCIEKGAGVSSEGHLFALKLEKDNDGEEVPCCLNAIAKVNMNYTAFNSYLQDKDLPGFGTAAGVKRSFDLFELMAGDPTVQASVPKEFSFSKDGFPKDYCLIMYWDIQPKDRKSCIDSCDGTGSDMDFKMRFFMISEDDLKYIWLNMIPAGSSGGSLFSDLFPFLTRLHKAQALDTMEQPGHLYDAWKKVVNDAIGTALLPGNIPTAVVGALNGQSSAPTATQLQTQLMAVFTTLTTGTPTHEPELQYFNDYLCDLVATVNEIAALSTQSVLTLCPDESLFPTFISLGNINNQVNATAKCRMPFYRLPLEGASDSSADKLAFLQQKLLCLIKGDEPMLPIVPINPTSKPLVRISGSDFKSLPLSEQAIPFYYRHPTDLRDKWNFELTRAGRQALIQSYEAYDNAAYPRNILCYDLKGEMFFRIEGHLGMSLSTGVTAIENLRKELNLPFKLVLLRISPKLNISYSGTDPNVLEILNYMQFSEFAKDHPGMEHMAGVPTGGTFIVVFKEEVNQDFQKALESPNTTPQTIELLIRNVKRTIIADFCLPYGCYSGPNVQYIFEEEVVGNQACRAEADFEERQINNLEYVFENRSPLADEFTWEVFRSIDGIATGAAIASQTFTKTDPNPLANFDYVFPYYGEFLVQLTAVCKDDHLTDKAQKVLTICPEEDVTITHTDQTGANIEELNFEQGDENDYTFIGAPEGGVWDYKDLKMAGMANPIEETEDSLTLNFSQVDVFGTAQKFLIKYVFPCENKVAEFAVTIIPPQNAQAKQKPTPLSLQIGYQQEANNIADSSLKSLSAFKKAMNYLQTPPPETDAVYGKFEETVAKLLASLDNPGQHDPEDFRLLLRNVVYLFLDRVMIDPRADAVKTALDTLAAVADKLSAQGINLNTWQGNTLPSTNPKTLKTITKLL